MITNKQMQAAARWDTGMAKPEAKPPLSPAACSAWQCDLGNGEWDHDWQEKTESFGELDGGPGDHWTWHECRVCGKVFDARRKKPLCPECDSHDVELLNG